MRIAVHGATGFTGGLVVAELERRGITPILVGRDETRLRAAALGAGVPDAEIRVAELADSGALTAAFAGAEAVVNAAGPFTLWGEPVVRAAIAAGAHYVDTTGELGYLHAILTGWDAAARRAGVSVVPGMADDGGPGDLIAALTAAHLGEPVQELLIADMRRPAAASRGTARSMAAIVSTEPVEFADGDWRPVTEFAPAPLRVPGEPDPVPVSVFPLPGIATIPRHVPARRVRSAIRAEAAALFTGLTADVVDSVPSVLSEAERATGEWLMLAHARSIGGRYARGWVTGPDGYGLTAVIAAEAARRLAAEGAPTGTLSPAQAFDPADFLDFLTGAQVSWKVEQLPAARD